MKWASWTILALGLWLIVAPFALAYAGTTAAAYEDLVLGIVVGALALWRGLSPETPVMTRVSWVLVAGGLWVLIAPFVIGYSDRGRLERCDRGAGGADPERVAGAVAPWRAGRNAPRHGGAPLRAPGDGVTEPPGITPAFRRRRSLIGDAHAIETYQGTNS